MNLHGIVRNVIPVINPDVQAAVRISIGNETSADGNRTPLYATPGQFVGSIAGTTLTVTAVSRGEVQAGQSLSDIGGFLAVGTTITDVLSPFPGTGSSGTYRVNIAQTVAAEVMSTSFSLRAQVQSLTFRDLTQIEGLNLQGTRRAIYLSGRIDGIVRSRHKGGDLISLPDGTEWLVAQVLEQWPDWCKVAVTLQDGAGA